MQPYARTPSQNVSSSNGGSSAKTPPYAMPPAKPLDVYAFVPSSVYTRKQQRPPPLTEDDILYWADLHFERTGTWPKGKDGPVEDAPGEKWANINASLQRGMRGLLGDSSLPTLLLQRRGVIHHLAAPPFIMENILAWADSHFARTGEWPQEKMRVSIPEAPYENWGKINAALYSGTRGLPGGTSLALLLQEQRGRRHCHINPPFSEAQVLQWVDAHFARTGEWPKRDSGPIPEAPGETWGAVDNALMVGTRGLKPCVSLPQFLHVERGVRNHLALPRLIVADILTWADAYFHRVGRYPNRHGGPIPEAPQDTWSSVDTALLLGGRGLNRLPEGSSLGKLLADERGCRYQPTLLRLTEAQVLAWADAHFARTGKWPVVKSGRVAGTAYETWLGINGALHIGLRGFPGGASLATLLARERGRRSQHHLTPLTESIILEWADAHFARTGVWPRIKDEPVSEAPEETWFNISAALRLGLRGLSGGLSLPRLLARERSVRNCASLPPLTEELILTWADAHFARIGGWPNGKGGPVYEAPEETWANINGYLHKGARGLPGGSTLPQLLARERGRRNRKGSIRFTEELILEWADAHYALFGKWPTSSEKCAPEQRAVPGMPGETWGGVNQNLSVGGRGLSGGSSLAQLLFIRRGRAPRFSTERFTEEKIIQWASTYRFQHGNWPTAKAGEIEGAGGTRWSGVNKALSYGCRGLPGGTTLRQLLSAQKF